MGINARRAPEAAERRLRFIGGPLNGQAIWISDERQALQVRFAPSDGSARSILEYRREGDGLMFVGQSTEPHGQGGE